jgi:hypothetical protein
MGIDNSSKLLFGMILSEEAISNILSKLSEKNVEIGMDDLCEYGMEEYPHLFFGYASPCYDAEENTYYVSFFDTDKTELSLEELSKLLADLSTDLSPMPDYRNFLQRFDIKYELPAMYSLPHIW